LRPPSPFMSASPSTDFLSFLLILQDDARNITPNE
jgi:hypothetical protein